jgi:3'-phosphoadenosine 5'-phosphosulfate sulfotransferase (PAPS reductase)/FAD synthetase
MNKELPIIGWFSCGATSAVACKIGLSMYENVRIVHIETGSEHSDNKRFLEDCQKWFGVEIQTIRSGKFDNVEDVLLKKKYINGPTGASCTKELKKQVRYLYEEALGEWGGANLGFRFLQRRNQQGNSLQTAESQNQASLSANRKTSDKAGLSWNP